MWMDKVRVFGLRRSGTNLMEWVVREHFVPHYNGIAVKQNNKHHIKCGVYENLKHCLPTLEYSEKAIVIYKSYGDWVESIERMSYKETSKEAYMEFMYHAMRLHNSSRYIVEYNDFINNYQEHMTELSKFLDIKLTEIKPLPRYKFNRDGGKTLSNEKFRQSI